MIRAANLTISKYINRKGEEKISVNVSYSYARALANYDKKILDELTISLNEFLDRNF
jgi:hypothetical protein|tara:strand:- start:6 stop:176 length:171 start_codon:yes stop_codon:yes gene_type:complete